MLANSIWTEFHIPDVIEHLVGQTPNKMVNVNGDITYIMLFFYLLYFII